MSDTARWLGVAELASAVSSGKTSAVEVARSALTRAMDAARLNAFLHLDFEGALAQAAAVDRRRARGEALGGLAGVPVAVKDNLCTRGVPTTCASRILEGYVPPFDAEVVRRLRGAGAVVLGKTNMDEFAMGSSNENSAFGPVLNPWEPNLAPGGSSGGSAAAVAAGIVPAALGSDTGGSVRQPASFCSVTALRPTYGRVSRYGLIAFASSLDQVGPLSRSVEDAAVMLGTLAGHDPRDSTSFPRPVPDYRAAMTENRSKRWKVGVWTGDADTRVDAEVEAVFRRALEALERSGCELRELKLPAASRALSIYYLIAPAEASSNLARFDGMRYGLRVEGSDLAATYARTRATGFGPEVKRRIMLGTYALSAGYYDAYYLRAQKARSLVSQEFSQAFESCDVVLSPTSPTVPFALGERTEDPLAMYMADLFTLPSSLAGLPSISIPGGLSAQGLPVGLQLVAPAFEEERLVQLGHALEQQLGAAKHHPAVSNFSD